MMRNRVILFSLFASVVTQGCAGFQEAYKDRLVDNKGTIQFGCMQKAYTSGSKAASNSNIRLMVRNSPDPEEVIVGYLWSQNSFRVPPVSVAGRLPNSVLAADLREILVLNGYQVVDDSQLAQVTINAGFTRIHSEQDGSSWTKLQGRTTSNVDVSMRAIHNGENIWHRSFSETENDKFYYALTSDIENTINTAYCRILENIDKAITDKDFANALEQYSR
jgi:hypothetical protein